jgi:hypothetical protein
MQLPKPGEGATFALPPPGTYPAVCYRVIDLGTQDVEWAGEAKKKHKISLSWELHDPDCQMDDGRPMSIHSTYTLSMHENATFRKHLEAWRGKPFSEDDFKSFAIENLIGVPCYIGVIHDKTGNWANVSAISPLPKQMDKPKPINPTVFLCLEKDQFDPEVLASLSDRTQEKVKSSPEYRRLMGDDHSPPPMKISENPAEGLNDPIPF